MNGHEGSVKLLLERADVNPNIPNISGQTALTLAACGGHTRVVELLSLSPGARPFSSTAIWSFMIIPSLILLFYSLAFISLSLSTIL